MLSRLWRRSRVRGLIATARYVRHGGRVHPAARIDGAFTTVTVGRGASVAERCVLATRVDGRVQLADGVWLAHDVEIETDGVVAIGANSTVQRRSSCNGNVTIGERCIVAPNVFLSSGTHEAGVPDRPVVVGDGCWLGVNAVIMPGVTIGDGAIVGANSVVTRDVDAGQVVAGAPARPVRPTSVARTLPR